LRRFNKTRDFNIFLLLTYIIVKIIEY